MLLVRSIGVTFGAMSAISNLYAMIARPFRNLLHKESSVASSKPGRMAILIEQAQAKARKAQANTHKRREAPKLSFKIVRFASLHDRQRFRYQNKWRVKVGKYSTIAVDGEMRSLFQVDIWVAVVI